MLCGVPAARRPGPPRATAPLLRRLSRHRTQARRRLHRRDAHLAREPDWAGQLGYSPEQLDAANRSAVALAEEVRTAAAADGITVVVSGCVGPRGDGYDPGDAMTPEDAERYHAVQIGTFANTTADQVTAITMTNAEEAIGSCGPRGGGHSGGDLVHRGDRRPASDGQPLHEAIEQVDAATDAGAAYFMVNCGTRHISPGAGAGRHWRRRLRRPARERIGEEPRRTRRGNRAR